MLGASPLRPAIAVVIATLAWTVLENRAAGHCLAGTGFYRACCQAATARISGNYRTATRAQIAHSVQYYRYSNRYGRPKPPIKRMGQINVRNRNGGIR
jgi:hypothetical protein